MATQRTKRKLKDISFEQKGAHIALCHKDQGVANQADYALVLKSKNFSKEFIEKMQQVRITMELPDFLSKFFYLYEDDAKILAYMMGYVEPVETVADEQMEAADDFQEWIKSRMESFEVLKSLKDSTDIAASLNELQEDEFMSILNDQERVEKAFEKMAEKESTNAANTAGEGKPQIAGEVNQEVSASVVNKSEVVNSTDDNSKETSMTQNVESNVSVEMVEKSQFESVQKELADQKVALQKALETIAAFEAEKKEQIAKARKQELEVAVKDADKAEVIFKAVKDAADEDFQAVVKALSELTAVVENSELFVEKGATTEEVAPVVQSPVERILKSKFQNKQ